LTDRRTRSSVDAQLVEGITSDHLRQVEETWQPAVARYIQGLISSGAPRSDWPQSWHWDWPKKMSALGNLLAYRNFAITRNGRLQGLMIVKTEGYRARGPNQTGQHLVYIDYVETAPWNRRPIVSEPEFSGVGTVFMRAAIEISREEGFYGRIGLHSLPQSEPFYRRLNMTELGADSSKQNLTYFEMTSEQADVFSS
jgi:hypothetical protein